MGKAIGIDLGTTNSVVAYKDVSVKIIQTGVNNEELCRSCVAIDNNDQILVGNTVFRNWKRYTPNIVVSVKRLMGVGFKDEQVQNMINDKKAYPFSIIRPNGGTDEAVSIVLRGREYTPEEISAEILKSLKNDADNKLGGDVTHAVITVPAYFTEKQKTATAKAAELAGIRVQRLLAEPTAAAISFGFGQMQSGEAKHIIVYDFGGGTFDLSILMAVDGQFIESGSGGDRWLGGDDIDRKLMDYVCSEIEKRDNFSLKELLNTKSEKEKAKFEGGLKTGVEEAKKSLSQAENATIYFSDFFENENDEPIDDFIVTRQKFEQLIHPLIRRTIDLVDELLKKANISEDTIDNILLVGGSSCIPLVRQMLKQRFGDKIMSSDKPMLAVAEGAAILAQSLPSVEGAIVTPGPPGGDGGPVITTTKHQTLIRVKDGYEKIIDSQEPLPREVIRKFYTSVDNQKIVEVQIFNDVENGGYNKITSGFFTISDNLPVHSELKFSFNLDVNELLSARVKVSDTGEETKIRLSRGRRDSRCLSDLSLKIEEIFQNSRIAGSNKATFISEIQTIIEDINRKNYSEDDERWEEIEQDVLASYSRALMGAQQENRLGEILATILLSEFSHFLNSNDASDLRNGLNEINNSNDELEKASLRQNLERISKNYSLLLTVYMFKLFGDNSNDKQMAGRARVVYGEMINALNVGNVSEVVELINQNDDILSEMSKEQINIGAGTGIV